MSFEDFVTERNGQIGLLLNTEAKEAILRGMEIMGLGSDPDKDLPPETQDPATGLWFMLTDLNQILALALSAKPGESPSQVLMRLASHTATLRQPGWGISEFLTKTSQGLMLQLTPEAIEIVLRDVSPKSTAELQAAAKSRGGRVPISANLLGELYSMATPEDKSPSDTLLRTFNRGFRQ